MIPVAYMATDGTRGPYPEGPKLQMTREWKDRVIAALSAMGRDNTWLAKELGVHKATVGRMLGDAQQSSALVPLVVEKLGVPFPMAEIRSAKEAEMLGDMRELPDEDFEQVRALVKRLKPRPR